MQPKILRRPTFTGNELAMTSVLSKPLCRQSQQPCGSGKTFIGALHVGKTAKRGEKWMCVSPENNMIRETTLPTFIQVMKLMGKYIFHLVSPTPKVRFRTEDGGKAELIFRGAEKPDKLRGPNRAGLWFD